MTVAIIKAPEIASWMVFPKLYLGEASLGDKTYEYFAEDASAKPFELNELPLEFFNHDLQKVDTTSTQSMKTFCEKWGLVFSPLYASKLHSQAARDITGGPGYSEYYPTIYRNGIEAVERQLAKDIAVFKGSYGFNDSSQAVQLLIGSELARETVARNETIENKRFYSVVSVDEVAYTIRLLQLATTAQVAAAAGLEGLDLRIFLTQTPAIQDRHPIALEDRGHNLFFANISIGAALVRQQEVIRGEQIGSELTSAKEAAIAHMKEIERISVAQGIENARSFMNQASISMALENAWAREELEEDYDIANSLFWGIPSFISEGSLVEAILVTFSFVMGASLNWQRCDYCGRIFKFQKEYDPSKRYRISRFCKNSCRVMAYQQGEQFEVGKHWRYTPEQLERRERGIVEDSSDDRADNS